METSIQQNDAADSVNQHISIKDCLRLIGIKELTANIYAVPAKKSRKEAKPAGAY